MLDSRIGQAAVMTAAIGMVFGMALTPIPNVTSKFILEDVLNQMDFHYDRHQAAVEATMIASSTFKPKFEVSQVQIQAAVDNPADCNNTEGDYFQFEKRIFSSNNCKEADSYSAYPGYAYSGSATYRPQQTDNPARISFYVRDATPESYEGQNSMNIVLGGLDS